MLESGWILEYLGMVESDMSAIHGIEDIRSMPARRFLGLAKRLIYYPNSALRQLVEIEQEQGSGASRNHQKPVATKPTATDSPKPEKHVYADVKYNLEAFQLGIIEGGTG